MSFGKKIYDWLFNVPEQKPELEVVPPPEPVVEVKAEPALYRPFDLICFDVSAENKIVTQTLIKYLKSEIHRLLGMHNDIVIGTKYFVIPKKSENGFTKDCFKVTDKPLLQMLEDKILQQAYKLEKKNYQGLFLRTDRLFAYSATDKEFVVRIETKGEVRSFHLTLHADKKSSSFERDGRSFSNVFGGCQEYYPLVCLVDTAIVVPTTNPLQTGIKEIFDSFDTKTMQEKLHEFQRPNSEILKLGLRECMFIIDKYSPKSEGGIEELYCLLAQHNVALIKNLMSDVQEATNYYVFSFTVGNNVTTVYLRQAKGDDKVHLSVEGIMVPKDLDIFRDFVFGIKVNNLETGYNNTVKELE